LLARVPAPPAFIPNIGRPDKETNMRIHRLDFLTILVACVPLVGPCRAAQPSTDLGVFRGQLGSFSRELAGGLQAYSETLDTSSAQGATRAYILNAAVRALQKAEAISPNLTERDTVRLREAFAAQPRLLDLPAAVRSAARTAKSRAAGRSSQYSADIRPAGFCASAPGARPRTSDLSGVGPLIKSFLELFEDKPDDVGAPPELPPTPNQLYRGGVEGESDCNRAQNFLDTITGIMPDAIASVGVALIVDVSFDIPNPIKMAFALIGSLNRDICSQMNLENTLNDSCTFDTTMDIIDTKLNNMRSEVRGVDAAVSTVDGRVLVVNTKVDRIGTDVTTINQKADNTLISIRNVQSKMDNDQALNFRLAVESELLQSGRGGLGTFALPAAQGGYLEEVRKVVADTIAKFRAAGQSVGSAEGEMANADAAVGRREYKAAFTSYRNAYRLAVQY
jgi:hypothetical protein